MIPPCPGSGTLPDKVDPISFSGACPRCGVRFKRAQLDHKPEVRQIAANMYDVNHVLNTLIPPHSPGSHHQEI